MLFLHTPHRRQTPGRTKVSINRRWTHKCSNLWTPSVICVRKWLMSALTETGQLQQQRLVHKVLFRFSKTWQNKPEPSGLGTMPDTNRSVSVQTCTHELVVDTHIHSSCLSISCRSRHSDVWAIERREHEEKRVKGRLGSGQCLSNVCSRLISGLLPEWYLPLWKLQPWAEWVWQPAQKLPLNGNPPTPKETRSGLCHHRSGPTWVRGGSEVSWGHWGLKSYVISHTTQSSLWPNIPRPYSTCALRGLMTQGFFEKPAPPHKAAKWTHPHYKIRHC